MTVYCACCGTERTAPPEAGFVPCVKCGATSMSNRKQPTYHGFG